MLNHTYTSVKNANLVDCGKKQHIPSQPSPLLRDNFLGEFRTDLDKKKVLANLGIATELSLEWEYIKGDIGRSEALIKELDSRTKYISELDGFTKSVIDGVKYLESVVGGEQEDEDAQNIKISSLETITTGLIDDVEELKTYLENNIDVSINTINNSLESISQKVNNITELIQVSSKTGNALTLIEGEDAGLYVPDLSESISVNTQDIEQLQGNVKNILDTYVTKDDLGGESFDFVEQNEFDSYTQNTNTVISNIQNELSNTVKTGEDGHVDTLFVNTISKNNNNDNIRITDSFEVTEGIPLDVRFVVDNLEELLALPASTCYSGMGVIVNTLSSLYILRKPSENTVLNQEYISNIYNWKCPEDLVTVALSRTEYDNLEEINPNVFYYVFEEEIKRTNAPKREEYGSLEEYENALQEWTDSLKVLSQEYMSASWGVDIEDKLSKKANQTTVNILNANIEGLQEQINNLSGGDSDTSLSNLAERVSTTESNLEFLLGTEGTDEEPSKEGKISEIESSIIDLDNKIAEQYVSKESITTETDSNDYIFVKKSDYNKDIEAMSEKVSTNLVETDSMEATTSISLADITLTSNGEELLVNTKEVALVDDVPKIIYLTQTEYEALETSGELDPDVYYYTTNEEVYVTKSELDQKINQLNSNITILQTKLQELSDRITTLEGSINS